MSDIANQNLNNIRTSISLLSYYMFISSATLFYSAFVYLTL